MKKILPIVVLASLVLGANAQQETSVRIQGKIYPAIIDECGDTVIVANLDRVSISSPRVFESDEEYKKYMRYRRAAIKVYPYAVEAIKTYRELEAEAGDLKKRKQRKYARELQKEKKDVLGEELKNLTRTQGFVLTKMIERELAIPMYDLIRDLRGGFTASYWGTLSRFYGYRLKDGYSQGEDYILDMVLDDFNISYELPETKNKKGKQKTTDN